MDIHEESLIDKYLHESRIARKATAKDKSKDVLISSKKISEITEATEQEIDDYLSESKRVEYLFINSGMKIYKIL